MTGETLNFKKHIVLSIGQYCQVHEEETPRNSQAARTSGANVLGTSGNHQGGFKLMSLQTGNKLTCRSWDEIPMPDTVIDCVKALGANQPELFAFTNRQGRPIGATKCSRIPYVSQTEERRKGQRENGCRRQQAKRLHLKGRRKLANHCHQICPSHLHHRCQRGKGCCSGRHSIKHALNTKTTWSLSRYEAYLLTCYLILHRKYTRLL